MPAFYNKPQSIDEIIDQGVGRVLDLFGLESGGTRRWEGA
jgi:3-polyprenyl-4-hydroxybenzoate decarboxylase